MTAVDTVVAELAASRKSGSPEPLVAVNTDMQLALEQLQTGNLPVPIASGTILSNITGAPAPAIGNMISAIFDALLGSEAGALASRLTGTWSGLAPSATPGALLQSNGASVQLSYAEPGQLTGTSTNDNAGVGKVGEYLSASATNVAIINSNIATIVSLGLSAGDWDVQGVGLVFANGASSTLNFFICGLSDTNNSDEGFPYDAVVNFGATGVVLTTNNNIQSVTPTRRFSLAAPATVYGIINAEFSSTMAANFFIQARRVR